MITWLKINFGQWPDHVDRPNKFLRCHVSTFLTDQNKEKKLTLDSLQAQNYPLLGLVAAEPFKVAEHSFGSLWVYVICQIKTRERLQLTSWNVASKKYTDERVWLTGQMWRFCGFHGNMNDWIQPVTYLPPHSVHTVHKSKQTKNHAPTASLQVITLVTADWYGSDSSWLISQIKIIETMKLFSVKLLGPN